MSQPTSDGDGEPRQNQQRQQQQQQSSRNAAPRPKQGAGRGGKRRSNSNNNRNNNNNNNAPQTPLGPGGSSSSSGPNTPGTADPSYTPSTTTTTTTITSAASGGGGVGSNSNSSSASSSAIAAAAAMSQAQREYAQQLQQASPTYVLMTANRDGQCQVFDFKNRPITTDTSGNIASFLNNVAPTVSLKTSYAKDATLEPHEDFGEKYFNVCDMLLAFSVPFGVPVQMSGDGAFLSESKPPEQELYYSPQLSGFRFEMRNKFSATGNSSNATSSASSPTSPGGAFSTSTTSTSASGGGTTTTTTSTETEEEKKKKLQQQQQQDTVIEWYEAAKPESRPPLVNQLEYLITLPQFSKLKALRNTDLAVTSWFSVLWVPIHVKTHTPQNSAGVFLCFYLVNPPASMPGSDYRRQDANCFYFRGDYLSTAPLHLWDAPNTVRGIEAFAPAPVPKMAVHVSVSVPSPPSSPSPVCGGADEASKESSVNSNSSLNKNDGESLSTATSNSNSLSSSMTTTTTTTTTTTRFQIIDQAHRMRVPIVGFIPCRTSADVWYRRYASGVGGGGGAGSFVYCTPLFLVASAMQLMQAEKGREIKKMLDEGKNIVSANNSARVLPDYEHLMRHESRLNEFMMSYSV